MKNLFLCLAALLCCFVVLQPAPGQAVDAKDSPAARPGEPGKDNGAAKPDNNEARTAAQFFEQADNYARNKFEEFKKRKMPFDRQLEEKIKQEQRDLAAQNARTLAGRKPTGMDVYYLGLLYNLARNFDDALETMRRFLTKNPEASGEPAQNARVVIIIQAAKKGLLPEAESRLEEYAKNQPQPLEDRLSLENWVTVGYFNLKNYERALPHAKQLWTTAQEVARKKTSTARDSTLNDAAITLSEIDLKLKKNDDAIAVIQELRQMALGIPSAKTRWASAGKLSRTPAWRARSTSATAQPRPRGTRCRMRPQ